jgi:hypothetical protein
MLSAYQDQLIVLEKSETTAEKNVTKTQERILNNFEEIKSFL